MLKTFWSSLKEVLIKMVQSGRKGRQSFEYLETFEKKTFKLFQKKVSAHFHASFLWFMINTELSLYHPIVEIQTIFSYNSTYGENPPTLR